MELRQLGRTGIDVSVVGLGTVTWGRLAGLNYAVPASLPDERRLADLLDTAEALGINLIDTAPAYGESEIRLGALLTGRRDRWRIATKAGEAFDGARSHFDFSRAAMLSSVTRSLRRLKTDHVDLVCIHSDGRDEGEAKFGRAVDALYRLKAQGRIGAVGFSAKTRSGADWAAVRCDVVMLTLNQTDRSMIPVLEQARRHQAAVLAKKRRSRKAGCPRKLFASSSISPPSRRPSSERAMRSIWRPPLQPSLNGRIRSPEC